MKTLTSTEFRQRYAALEEPTEVTALGRLIGTWFPVGNAIDSRATDGIRPGEPVIGGSSYSTRPFTPVPKK